MLNKASKRKINTACYHVYVESTKVFFFKLNSYKQSRMVVSEAREWGKCVEVERRT